MKVCRVGEIRDLDQQGINLYGIPAAVLMENAGNAVYQVIRREAEIPRKNFLVFCGPGNNGGDGFVIARLLQANGAVVKTFVLADSDKYGKEAKNNLEILLRFPGIVDTGGNLNRIKSALKSAFYVIDALLGTGVDRPVEGIVRQVIEMINRSGKQVFAVDIPSGTNGDTGQEMGISVRADYTVTFGLPKAGNLLYPGYERGGKLYVSHISFPPALTGSDKLKIEVPEPVPLPARKAAANKFDYGPLLVIAGAANYYWAPYASAYSFLKAGGGYVFLASPQSVAKSVARRGKEIVFLPQIDTINGSIALKNKNTILEYAARAKFVVIGPGLSLDNETQQLVRELAAEIEKPLLIDGDGITAMAGHAELLLKRRSPTVLTPHVGEMRRLTGKTVTEIESNRVDILQKTAARYNACVVLKGPHSLTGLPDGRVYINTSGNTGGQAGMATAGSGDVLNGTIAAMYCLGLNLEEAVYTGVFIHGLAGDIATADRGADGVTASDILNTMPAAVKHYRRDVTPPGAGSSNIFNII